ncbi:uncharacterized protein V2V93DRAFT_373931 [Kockiozyma suomiensis]|uniref:uncharacterized protein n=1 Tax=Kockiozyma suomiensis TaxID=1337062 RepID=UPI0033438E2D
MAKSYATVVFVAGMLVTGCSNSLLTKFQDNQCVENCDGDPNGRRYFEQPVIQTFQMFIAEAACWCIVFFRYMYASYVYEYRANTHIDGEDTEEEMTVSQLQISTDANMSLLSSEGTNSENPVHTELITPLNGKKVFGLSVPAFCDICGTTLMNVGLFFTPVSIYQMTRGALVLFVGIFSVIFLRHKLLPKQWFALGIVVTGVFLVGLSGVIYAPETDEADKSTAERSINQVIFGVLLIAMAQIFTATQFVYEEHILQDYHLDSMRVVGYEGIFGLMLTGVIMIVGYLFIGSTEGGKNGYFDVPAATHQIFTQSKVLVSSLLIMISIGSFNFFGISVTRTVSATSRSTIDTCRTLGIWLISIVLGWENFKMLQLVGFALLVYGTLVFNGIISPYISKKLESSANSGRIRLGEDELE